MTEVKTLPELLCQIETLVVEYVIQLYRTREEAAQALGIARRSLFNKTPSVQTAFGALAKDFDGEALEELDEKMDEVDRTLDAIRKNLLLIEKQ